MVQENAPSGLAVEHGPRSFGARSIQDHGLNFRVKRQVKEETGTNDVIMKIVQNKDIALNKIIDSEEKYPGNYFIKKPVENNVSNGTTIDSTKKIIDESEEIFDASISNTIKTNPTLKPDENSDFTETSSSSFTDETPLDDLI